MGEMREEVETFSKLPVWTQGLLQIEDGREEVTRKHIENQKVADGVDDVCKEEKRKFLQK